jgi:hypothetical protein
MRSSCRHCRATLATSGQWRSRLTAASCIPAAKTRPRSSGTRPAGWCVWPWCSRSNCGPCALTFACCACVPVHPRVSRSLELGQGSSRVARQPLCVFRQRRQHLKAMGGVQWSGAAGERFWASAIPLVRVTTLLGAHVKLVRTIMGDNFVRSVAVSPDGRYVYSGYEALSQWDASSGAVRTRMRMRSARSSSQSRRCMHI